MSVLQVGTTTLEDGKVRVCVPIAYGTEKESLEEADRIAKSSAADIAEWRIDWYENVFDAEKLHAVAGKIHETLQEKPLLITFRSKKEGGEKNIEPCDYAALLERVIESHAADLIDIELSQGSEVARSLIQKAHEAGIGVIMSRHDFEKTPDVDNLIASMEEMAECGADVCKIAMMPHSYADVATLLSATGTMKEKHPEKLLITMSMGPKGCVSRLCGGLFGSVMSFGSIGKASAPGQVSASGLKEVLAAIENAVQ